MVADKQTHLRRDRMQDEASQQNSQVQYGCLGLRFVALAADFFFLSLVFFPVTRVVKGVWIMSSEEHFWEYGWLVTDPLCLIFLLVIVLYFVLLEGTHGATIGKRLCRLRVVGMDNRKPGIARSAVRNILRAIDALPAFNILGVVLIITSPEKARFGDRVAGTRVIRIR